MTGDLATAADWNRLLQNLDRMFPYDWLADARESRERLRLTIMHRVAEQQRERVVFRAVAPDTFEVGLEGATTRHRLARAGFRAAHAAIRGDAPVRVLEYLEAGKGDLNDRMRNMIRRAADWFAVRGYAALAFALGPECMRVEAGLVVYDPPANAPRILT